jgi:hypothetical protein
MVGSYRSFGQAKPSEYRRPGRSHGVDHSVAAEHHYLDESGGAVRAHEEHPIVALACAGNQVIDGVENVLIGYAMSSR